MKRPPEHRQNKANDRFAVHTIRPGVCWELPHRSEERRVGIGLLGVTLVKLKDSEVSIAWLPSVETLHPENPPTEYAWLSAPMALPSSVNSSLIAVANR